MNPALVFVACSWFEGVSDRLVLPSDGAEGVPTNARVVVQYQVFSGVGPVPDTLVVRPEGGEAIEVEVTATRLTGQQVLVIEPAAELEPGTTYEVLDEIEAGAELCETAVCMREPTVFATFRTGAGPDEASPELASAGVTTEYVAYDDDSCGPGGAAVEHEVTVEASDDRLDVLYDYLDADGNLIGTALPLVSVGHICEGSSLFGYDLEIETDTFQIRAVDLAGNPSAAITLRGESCKEASGEGGGCDAGGGGAGGAVLLGLGLAALAVRSRSRPR